MQRIDPQETFLESKITAVYRPFSVAHGWVLPLARLASDAVLDVAYGWLCHRRWGYPPVLLINLVGTNCVYSQWTRRFTEELGGV